MKKIKTNVLRWFKYRAIRLYLKTPKLEKKFSVAHLNAEQQAGIKIVKRLAVHPDSEILMAPISEKYYIQNGEIFIVIEMNQISIINSVYHYDIYNNHKVTDHIINFMRRIIERRRSEMEAAMRSKIQRSLSHILEDIDTRLNKKGED